jgi:SAM-dependent methyltransferase
MTLILPFIAPDRRRSQAPLAADAIHGAVREYIEGSDNPDVLAYGRNFLGHYARGRWMIEYMMRLGNMRHARVLDVGCGFGWQAMMIALLGGNEVVANDIRESMTHVVCTRTRAFEDALASAGGAVTPLLGDICTLDVEPESFDAIFCNQTVEHIHDLRSFFAAARRALRPGGRMVVANDNNALNPGQFDEVSKMWAQRDRSQAYVDRLKRERPIENAGIEPYAVMRERIIRSANPHLPASQVSALADATAGMIEPDIRAFAGRYVPGDERPTPPKYSWSRNPVTGEYCERQLDPYELSAEIDAAGFRRSTVRHAFRQFPLRPLNGVQIRPLNVRLFAKRSVFVIVAERE